MLVLKSWLVTSKQLEVLKIGTNDILYLYLTDTLYYKIQFINNFYEATEYEVINNTYYLASIYTKSDTNLKRLISDLIG